MRVRKDFCAVGYNKEEAGKYGHGVDFIANRRQEIM